MHVANSSSESACIKGWTCRLEILVNRRKEEKKMIPRTYQNWVILGKTIGLS